MLTLLALGALVVIAVVAGVTMLAVVGRPSSGTSGTPNQVLPLEPVDIDAFVDGLANIPFAEQRDTAVREMEILGLHCVVVEELPLFDHFAMFSAQGDQHVKQRVAGQAARLQAQLGDDATRDERGRAVWSDDWSPSWPDRDWCLTQLELVPFYEADPS